MTEQYKYLLESAARWVHLNDVQQQMLISVFSERTLNAHEHLVLPGSATHEVLFVVKGLLRFYYVGNEGKETWTTDCFWSVFL